MLVDELGRKCLTWTNTRPVIYYVFEFLLENESYVFEDNALVDVTEVRKWWRRVHERYGFLSEFHSEPLIQKICDCLMKAYYYNSNPF